MHDNTLPRAVAADKKFASDVQRALQEKFDIHLKSSDTLNLVAMIRGYRSWTAYKSSPEPDKSDDVDVDVGAVAAQWWKDDQDCTRLQKALLSRHSINLKVSKIRAMIAAARGYSSWKAYASAATAEYKSVRSRTNRPFFFNVMKKFLAKLPIQSEFVELGRNLNYAMVNHPGWEEIFPHEQLEHIFRGHLLLRCLWEYGDRMIALEQLIPGKNGFREHRLHYNFVQIMSQMPAPRELTAEVVEAAEVDFDALEDAIKQIPGSINKGKYITINNFILDKIVRELYFATKDSGIDFSAAEVDVEITDDRTTEIQIRVPYP